MSSELRIEFGADLSQGIRLNDYRLKPVGCVATESRRFAAEAA
jgi:hypothetical protein